MLLADDDGEIVTDDVKAIRFNRLINMVLLPSHNSFDMTDPSSRDTEVGYKQ